MARKTKPEALLGKRINELRRQAGLTQEELGEAAGINYKYLGSIERGLENPSFKHLFRLARALRVPVEEIFRFSHLEPDRSRMLKEIGLSLSQMSDSELKLAFKFIKSFK